MNIKELEIQRAEELVIKYLPPIAQTFVLNSKKINDEIEKLENLLMSFMNDNGTIDGRLLNKVFIEKYPKLAEWISIPETNFYLKDELDIILRILFRGGNNYER